ncbi:MAG: hypothetical protein HOF35_10035 [Bacteroidetes bacterium]|nr:hypothetical protein [Bacteroidota bacterium]MBT4729446.1 hypothetical protein [Bacteroidota bacterium]
MNKIYKIGMVLSLCLISFFTFSQNVEDIIKKHIDAHGGAKKIAAIQTMKITGKFTAFSEVDDYTAFKRNDGSYYADLRLDKYKVFEAFDGKNGWTIDPWQEIDFPRQLNKTEVGVMMQKADMVTPFHKYKEKGYKVEYLGEKEVDGEKVFALKLIRNNMQEEIWYLNTETYLEFKCESQWVDFAWPSPCETYFDDFRKVNGVLFPFYVERTFSIRNRILEIEKIKINTEFDNSKLVLKRNPEMEKLAFLGGKWSVLVKAMTRRGTFMQIDSVSSMISSIYDQNMLTEHISYERMFPMDRVFTFTYNSWTKKYRLAAYNSFGSNHEVFEGDFVEDKLVFELVNIAKEETQYRFVKFEFSEMTDTGFVLEKQESKDGAEWMARDRFEYTRINIWSFD